MGDCVGDGWYGNMYGKMRNKWDSMITEMIVNSLCMRIVGGIGLVRFDMGCDWE